MAAACCAANFSTLLPPRLFFEGDSLRLCHAAACIAVCLNPNLPPRASVMGLILMSGHVAHEFVQLCSLSRARGQARPLHCGHEIVQSPPRWSVEAQK